MENLRIGDIVLVEGIKIKTGCILEISDIYQSHVGVIVVYFRSYIGKEEGTGLTTELASDMRVIKIGRKIPWLFRLFYDRIFR